MLGTLHRTFISLIPSFWYGKLISYGLREKTAIGKRMPFVTAVMRRVGPDDHMTLKFYGQM